jgi:hypothetical protein
MRSAAAGGQSALHRTSQGANSRRSVASRPQVRRMLSDVFTLWYPIPGRLFYPTLLTLPAIFANTCLRSTLKPARHRSAHHSRATSASRSTHPEAFSLFTQAHVHPPTSPNPRNPHRQPRTSTCEKPSTRPRPSLRVRSPHKKPKKPSTTMQPNFVRSRGPRPRKPTHVIRVERIAHERGTIPSRTASTPSVSRVTPRVDSPPPCIPAGS